MGRNLVVFADGTGNAFSAHESNIWRLYQALDQGGPEQLARYIKGVGTSGLRPLATLDGVTGFGVPSNVRELYRFLCWTWEPGDRIYAFGFSRGAFTIRALIGLISSQGLVPREIGGERLSKAEMARNAMAAWRAYRASGASWRDRWPTIIVTRRLRDGILRLWHGACRHRPYAVIREETARQGRSEIPIRFLGLFDTVEAYGVPLEGLRHAIDQVIWPISFANRKLSPRVEEACHALALDDERATFHPVRFEADLRIDELWFAGVHSDVGGGYPDAALAHVPLLWIARRAAAAGLQWEKGAIAAFERIASPFGPLHDSRSGMAVMYRYAPRPMTNGAERPEVIDHSVIEKIAAGSEGYAPVIVPQSALIRLPDDQQVLLGQPAVAGLAPGAAPAVQALAQVGLPERAQLEDLRDHSVLRELAYILLVVALCGVALLPWLASWLDGRLGTPGSWLRGFADGLASVLGAVTAPLRSLLPSIVHPWLDTLVAHPVVALLLLVPALRAWLWNAQLRDDLRDRARRAWRPGPGPREALPRRVGIGALARLRRWQPLRRLQQGLARIVLPWLIVAVLVWPALRTITAFQAASGGLCRGSDPAVLQPAAEARQVSSRSPFDAREPCWASGFRLQAGHHYRLWLEADAPLRDATHAAGLTGFWTRAPVYLAGWPLRRWLSEPWFQPIGRIDNGLGAEWPLRSMDGRGPLAPWDQPPASDWIVHEFTAAKDGELFLYLNDAMILPVFAKLFYGNNHGSIRVSIQRIPPPAGSPGQMWPAPPPRH